MAYTPSLSPVLYETADTKLDSHFMDLMSQQDRTPVSTDSAKPRFTLLVGPSPFTMPRGWEFFLTSPYEGVSYIGTVLHNAGYPVRIVDVRYERDPKKAAYDQIMAGTDVLGIATFEDNFPFMQELIAEVRAAAPTMPIIAGGSLVTSVPHIFMEHTAIDVAVISEGELTILELMDSYTRGAWSKELHKIRGIWYRDANGRALATMPRGQMAHLDALPRMNLGLWPQSKDPRGLQPQIIASYSRGCKLDCSFCYRTTPQERVKSADKLDADLAHLKKEYGVEFIMFVDLTFTAHKKKTREVCEVIGQHDIRWGNLTRCTDVDAERLEAMKSAGADINLYGVESLGKDALKEARKASSENASVRALHLTQEAGIRFGGLLIVGLPGEDEDSLRHMSEWSEENGSITRVKYLSAMPGTTVYRNGIETGLMRSEVDHLNWLSIEQALVQDEFINYTQIDERLMREAYKRVYDSYLPGPVMNFEHYPEYFLYFQPNKDDGAEHSIRYAGEGWRADHSSAGPALVPNWERFTLDKTGTADSVERGAALKHLFEDEAA